MPKQNIAELAKANNISPETVRARIKKGMSVEEAASKSPRKYTRSQSPRPAKKAERVWAYLLDNKLATPSEVALATGVSYAYAYKLMRKIGTPREVFEKEAALPLVAQKEDRLLDDDDDTHRWLQLTFLIAIAAVITAWVFSVTAK